MLCFMVMVQHKTRRRQFYWYKKAARKNDPKALYNLGLCYKFGDGVNKSMRWAIYYFEKAMYLEHKNAKAQFKSFAVK